MGRKKFSADFQLMFRLLKLFLFIGFIVTLVVLFKFLSLTVGDIFASLLAFLPTGWALLQVTISYLQCYSLRGFCLSIIATNSSGIEAVSVKEILYNFDNFIALEKQNYLPLIYRTLKKSVCVCVKNLKSYRVCVCIITQQTYCTFGK